MKYSRPQACMQRGALRPTHAERCPAAHTYREVPCSPCMQRGALQPTHAERCPAAHACRVVPCSPRMQRSALQPMLAERCPAAHACEHQQTQQQLPACGCTHIFIGCEGMHEHKHYSTHIFEACMSATCTHGCEGVHEHYINSHIHRLRGRA